MSRFLLLIMLFVLTGPARVLAQPAAEGLPPRPTPFQFVNDQAQLLGPDGAKKLEAGLRRYADNTGTQVVVVTVPTLGGREVADYGRALGEAWGVGQRDKNNGMVVLISKQERKVTIQAGSGLRDKITPELTNRVISQEMTPRFKQGDYLTGLRTGLSSLMLAANPTSAPQKSQPAAAASAATPASAGVEASGGSLANEPATAPAYSPEPSFSPASAPEPAGPGMGTLLIGALVVGGVIWLLVRMFRRRSAAANTAGPYNAGPTNAAPDFYGRGNPGPGPGPAGNYGRNQGYPQQGPGNYGGGMGGGMGSGMGGILMTGAAAAAGAYLGNRMASGHDTPGSGLSGHDTPPQHLDPGSAGAAGAAGAAGGGFAALNDDGSGAGNNYHAAPDYFADDAGAGSTDYFTTDDSSYDDMSGGDTGGGGFDSTDDNSGSW